jgi:hypothetical protein
VDSAAPMENLERSPELLRYHPTSHDGEPLQVHHRRLENSLGEFSILTTGSTTARVIARGSGRSPRHAPLIVRTNTALTRDRSNDRIIPVGAKKERGRGRPRKTQSRLSRWIDTQKLERGQVAARLGIGRTYLDKLCREEARPSLELAVAIEKFTGGAVPAADWLRVAPHSAR